MLPPLKKGGWGGFMVDALSLIPLHKINNLSALLFKSYIRASLLVQAVHDALIVTGQQIGDLIHSA